jgi:CBS domain-containing protein
MSFSTQEIPVLSSEDNKVLGIVTISDLVKLYDKEVEKGMQIRKDNQNTFSSVVVDTRSAGTIPNENLKKP